MGRGNVKSMENKIENVPQVTLGEAKKIVSALTDGYIDYPPEDSVPFEVLWCIIGSGDKAQTWFNPGYGRVVGIPVEPIQSYGR